jgi:hypothetical protein
MKFAIKNVGFEELDNVLVGTTSLAISNDDPIAPARIIKEYANKLPNYFEIKAGFMDGKVLSLDEVNAIASIPALPILQAQLLGTMLAPITSLAVVLKAIAEKGGEPADVEVKVDAKPEATPEAPSVEAAPAAAEAAAVEAAPVVEAAPSVEAAPAVESAPPVEAAPEVESAQEVEATPAEEKAKAPAKKPAAKKPAAKKETAEPTGEKAEKAPAKKPAAKKTDKEENPSE